MTSLSDLAKGHEEFRKRQAEASAFVSNAEKRGKFENTSTQRANRPKSTMARSKTSYDFTNEPRSESSRGFNAEILMQIVTHLRSRFFQNITEPLSLDEIIAELNAMVDPSERHRLASDILLRNSHINVVRIDDMNKFVYKPPLELKSMKRKGLLELLKTRHEKCEGAVLLSDLYESMPQEKADAIVKSLVQSGQIAKKMFSRREVLYYTDIEYDLQVHTEFKESWAKTSVGSLDNDKIVKYLEGQGYRGCPENTPRFVPRKKKEPRRQNRQTETYKYNQHVKDQLKDFSNADVKK